MLFDLSLFRSPLPENVMVFASGSNRVSEIRGFARVGIPVGVAVNELSSTAITTLIYLNKPVLIDSGAFSEVSFASGEMRVMEPISHAEWLRRLSIYQRLADALGNKAMIVAPDQVANQEETLLRLRRYRGQLAQIAKAGAALILPLQVGNLSHAAFYRAALEAAGVPLIPAAPMKKAPTSYEALLDFIREVRPSQLHMLGIGIENRRAGKLIRAIRFYAPSLSLTLDSNRLRATIGTGRPLTVSETELRNADIESLYGEIDSPVLAATGEKVDYTDSIAFPSQWATAEALRQITEEVGLLGTDVGNFVSNPDEFL
jgi:hypothetical protein